MTRKAFLTGTYPDKHKNYQKRLNPLCKVNNSKIRIYLVAALLIAISSCFGCASKNDYDTAKASTRPALKPQEQAIKTEQTSGKLRIGHYQCVCQPGNFEENLKTVIHGLKLAREAKLDIVSFPESFLTGYFASEKDARANCFAMDSQRIKKLLAETAGFEILFMVGFNELRGEKLYNTVAVIEKGKILGTYSKAFPVIDYFTPGREFPVFEKNGVKFGIVICADGGYIEPCRILALKGARIVFAPHSNYVRDPVKHYQLVRNDHIARAVENSIYFLRANNVIQGHNVKGLPYHGYGYGDSHLINPSGQIVAGAGLYNEYLMIYNLDLNNKNYPYRCIERNRKSASALIEILKQALGTSP